LDGANVKININEIINGGGGVVVVAAASGLTPLLSLAALMAMLLAMFF
jgi:hypothetical protein